MKNYIAGIDPRRSEEVMYFIHKNIYVYQTFPQKSLKLVLLKRNKKKKLFQKIFDQFLSHFGRRL